MGLLVEGVWRDTVGLTTSDSRAGNFNALRRNSAPSFRRRGRSSLKPGAIISMCPGRAPGRIAP